MAGATPHVYVRHGPPFLQSAACLQSCVPEKPAQSSRHIAAPIALARMLV